jgi:pimeloyl-ACP methyl ester carboxylesterase
VYQVKINNLAIGYQRMGKGESIVILHGGVSDSREWQRELDSYSDAYDVIVWDAPGCGQSDDPPQGFSLSDYADTLAEFLFRLGVRAAHVLGISFGAGLAIQFYHLYPEIPLTLILVSAYAGWAGSLAPAEVERRLELGRQQVMLDPEEVADMWLPTLFHKPPKESINKQIRSILTDFHPIGSQVMLEAFAAADLREILPHINIPTLLLYGDKDIRSPLEVAEAIHRNIPNSELVVLTDVGHVINIEAPQLFDTHVRKFLAQHRG